MHSIGQIVFPVYLLPSDDWYTLDRVLWTEGKVLDDTNMPGKTLGIRRFQTPLPLYPLRKCVNDYTGLIKQRTKFFIDSKGVPFIYVRTKFVKLKYVKIDKLDRREVATIVHTKVGKYPVPRPPHPDMKWAGILFLHGFPWKLYEFSEEEKKDRNKKV